MKKVIIVTEHKGDKPRKQSCVINAVDVLCIHESEVKGFMGGTDPAV